jgi:hypothetical protein
MEHFKNPMEDDNGAISLSTSWMIFPLLFQKSMHSGMMTTERNLSIVRWIPFWIMELGRSMNVLMDANLYDVSRCLRKS